MHENVKLITAVSSTSKYKKLFKMQNKDVGDVMCWRVKGRICTADCAAWNMYDKKDPNCTVVRCEALPSGRDNYLAVIPKKEEKQKEGELDE